MIDHGKFRHFLKEDIFRNKKQLELFQLFFIYSLGVATTADKLYIE